MSVSRVGQMQQGKATPWKGQGNTQGCLGGSTGLTGGIYHSLKMLAPYQTHTYMHTHSGNIYIHTRWYSEDPWEEARPLSLLPLTQGHRRAPRGPCTSAFCKITRFKKPAPDKCAPVKDWGTFFCLCVSDWGSHGRSTLKECLFTAIAVTSAVRGPFKLTILTLSLSLSVSTDVHQPLHLDIQHTLSACYGPTGASV